MVVNPIESSSISKGSCPIIDSIQKGDLEIFKKLINESNVNNGLGSQKGTAAAFAAYHGKIEILKYLFGIGANFTICDNRGYNSLHDAIENNQLEVLKFFKECGLSFAKENNNNICLFLHAIEWNVKDKILNFLLENNYGALNLIYPDQDENTPLLIAAKNNCMNVLKFILEKQPNALKDRNKYKEDALMVAVFHNQLNTVKFLVEKDKTILVRKDNRGLRAIHIAAYYGKIEILKYLMEFDFDPDEEIAFYPEDDRELTNILKLAKPKCKKIIETSIELLNFSKGQSIIKSIKDLIEEGACPLLKIKGQSLLHFAVDYNKPIAFLEILKAMLKSGYKLNQINNLLDNMGRTPLEIAVVHQKYELIISYYIFKIENAIENKDLNEAQNYFEESFNLLKKINPGDNQAYTCFNFWKQIKLIPHIKDINRIIENIFIIMKARQCNCLEFAKEFLNYPELNKEAVCALKMTTQFEPHLNMNVEEAHEILGELYLAGKIGEENELFNGRSENTVLDEILSLDNSENKKLLENNIIANQDTRIAMALLHFCQANQKKPEVIMYRKICTNSIRKNTLDKMILGDPRNPFDLIGILHDANQKEEKFSSELNKMQKTIKEKESENKSLQELLQKSREELAKLQGELSMANKILFNNDKINTLITHTQFDQFKKENTETKNQGIKRKYEEIDSNNSTQQSSNSDLIEVSNQDNSNNSINPEKSDKDSNKKLKI